MTALPRSLILGGVAISAIEEVTSAPLNIEEIEHLAPRVLIS